MNVDPNNPKHDYEQLADILRAQIRAGEYAGRPLPSNRTLQQTYGIGEYVVTHAIRVLEEEGYVVIVPRRGVYVAPASSWPRA